MTLSQGWRDLRGHSVTTYVGKLPPGAAWMWNVGAELELGTGERPGERGGGIMNIRVRVDGCEDLQASGDGDTGSRGEERGQAVKFSLGTGSFAGTPHSQVGCSRLEFQASGMFPEEMLRDILYGLWCSRRGLGELLVCLGEGSLPSGAERMRNFVRSIHIVEARIGCAWEGDRGGARLEGGRGTAALEEARADAGKSWSWAKRRLLGPGILQFSGGKEWPCGGRSQRDTLPSLSAVTLIPMSILPPPTCFYRDPVRKTKTKQNNLKRSLLTLV